MSDPNKIKKKVPINDFIIVIRKYASEQIEDSGHIVTLKGSEYHKKIKV